MRPVCKCMYLQEAEFNMIGHLIGSTPTRINKVIIEGDHTLSLITKTHAVEHATGLGSLLQEFG